PLPGSGGGGKGGGKGGNRGGKSIGQNQNGSGDTPGGQQPSGAAPTASPDDTVPSEVYTKSMEAFGRRVIDFTAGFAVTNLVNDNFTSSGTKDSASDTTNLGAAAYATYYLYRKPMFGLGPTFGVLVDSPPRYLLGGSFVYGTNVRVALSAG